jgi:predicted nucleotidyltransferase
MLTENDIARISRRVVEAYAPLVVGTFGSYAIGTASERSDLDLFVIRESCDQPATRARSLHRVLFGVLHPLDVHVFTPEEFEETAYDVLSFTWVIARQARLYHWTEAAARLVPSLRSLATSPLCRSTMQFWLFWTAKLCAFVSTHSGRQLLRIIHGRAGAGKLWAAPSSRCASKVLPNCAYASARKRWASRESG